MASTGCANAIMPTPAAVAVSVYILRRQLIESDKKAAVLAGRDEGCIETP